MFKKIVIIGPESTGKSTLCEQLAQHYKTLWVPEFAREYLEKNGMDYTYENLITIAKGQVALEEEYTHLKIENQPHQRREEIGDKPPPFTTDHSPPDSHRVTTHHQIAIGSLLFIDTDMYVMKVWCEFVFDKCHNWILNQIATRKYDLYLLCNVDLPWVKDNLREYPDLVSRTKLYYYYKDIMVNQATPWIDISGDYEERFKKAIHEIGSIAS